MKASRLIKYLAEMIGEYGDKEVKIGFLTENDDYVYDVHYVERYVEGEDFKHQLKFTITHEIEDVKEFKKNFK